MSAVGLVAHLSPDVDREAKGAHDLTACRHHPGRAHDWRDGDHDALDIFGGQSGSLQTRGVGHVRGRRGVDRDKGRQSGEHELARRTGTVVNRRGGYVDDRVQDGRVGTHRSSTVGSEWRAAIRRLRETYGAASPLTRTSPWAGDL